MAEDRAALVCEHCDCDIESCAFCDSEDCPKPVCYGCVIVDIGQEIEEPHAHGG
jgi:hypothetical protein